MISLAFWFLVGAAIAVYLLWIGGMLCEMSVESVNLYLETMVQSSSGLLL
jgi:hypothetical protein